MGNQGLLAACATLAIAGPAAALDLASSVAEADVPERKQTTIGLYLSMEDAAAALEADPSIVFIDVRDPVEATLVGHPDPIDAIVPLQTITHEFNPEKGVYTYAPNPSFVEDVAKIVAREGGETDDPIFITCRGGVMTARAVDALAEAGYSNVWALYEGVEGGVDPETDHRTIDGWKNAGLPWSYKITAEQAWTPAE